MTVEPTLNTARSDSNATNRTDDAAAHQWWTDDFDERERNEIRFAHIYYGEFQHGTDGHNRLLLISKLAIALDRLSENMRAVESMYRLSVETNETMQRRVDEDARRIDELRAAYDILHAENQAIRNAAAKYAPSASAAFIEQLECALDALVPVRSWSGKLRGYKSDVAFTMATEEVRRLRAVPVTDARALLDGALAVLRKK